MAQQLSPMERAARFVQSTRRYWSHLGSKTGSANGSVSFDIPKSRLLAGIRLLVKATLTATHSSATSYSGHEDSPWKFIKRVEVNLNNGFMPFSITGQALRDLNMSINGVVDFTAYTSGRYNVVQGLTASSGGTANTVEIMADLPNMINERDPIGLILLENDETNVTVTITFGDTVDLAPVSSGYTFAVSAISAELLTDTFSIPASQDAFPDLSVLKLCQERTETIIAGENNIKLPTGQTYRKLGIQLFNATPARVADTGVTGNFELIFNQAAYPYRIPARHLAAINAKEYGGPLPNGTWIFDFSDNGIPGFGSGRDYIDTERMTDFTLRFTSGAAGTARLWMETLTRLNA